VNNIDHEMEIAEGVLKRYAQAWNDNDHGALGQLLDENAAWVDVRGAYFKGRDAIQRQHQAELAGRANGSTMRAVVVDARPAARGVIVGHARAELEIAGQTRTGLVTFVMEHRAAGWLITSAHNSTVAARPS
jgi:uncharacterized protein (TIGR02246 family)